MVQSTVALLLACTGGLLGQAGTDDHLRAAEAFCRSCRQLTGHGASLPPLMARGFAGTGLKRAWFDFEGTRIVIDRDTRALVGFGVDTIPSSVEAFSGSIPASSSAILNQFMRANGYTDEFQVPSHFIDEVEDGGSSVFRGSAWQVNSPSVYWRQPISFEIDGRTGRVKSFAKGPPCNPPLSLQTVDTPESSWLKVAGAYLNRFPRAEWVERKTPLVKWLENPSDPFIEGSSQAPDFGACLTANRAWVGFSFGFKVFYDGQFHHWSHGCVDGRTGTYLRVGDSGGFEFPTKGEKTIPPWSDLQKGVSVSLASNPKAMVKVKIDAIVAGRKLRSGKGVLVTIGASSFLAIYDTGTRRFSWRSGKMIYEAIPSPELQKALTKLK